MGWNWAVDSESMVLDQGVRVDPAEMTVPGRDWCVRVRASQMEVKMTLEGLLHGRRDPTQWGVSARVVNDGDLVKASLSLSDLSFRLETERVPLRLAGSMLTVSVAGPIEAMRWAIWNPNGGTLTVDPARPVPTAVEWAAARTDAAAKLRAITHGLIANMDLRELENAFAVRRQARPQQTWWELPLLVLALIALIALTVFMLINR